MPLLTPADLTPLFPEIAAGRLKLVAWGAVDVAALYQWACPLPVAYFIDTDWRRWGKTHCGLEIRSPSVLESEDPKTTLVVVQYHMMVNAAELYDFLDRLGPFRYFVPVPIDLRGTSQDESLQRLVVHDPVTADKGTLSQAFLDLPPGDEHWARLTRLLRRQVRRDAVPSRHRKAVLLLECLHLGGAERQLCCLATGLAQAGWDTSVVVGRPEPVEALHYRHSLRDNGIHYHLVPPDAQVPPDIQVTELLNSVAPDIALILWHLPPHLVRLVAAWTRYLRDVRPSLVVCYLDRANVIGGVAAVLAGVPRVLLSGRNVNPSHFPHFFAGQIESTRALYQALLGSGGVRLSANSRIGAQSYAQWLGVPVHTVPVVMNCVAPDVLTPLDPQVPTAMRALLGLPQSVRVVLGGFRLAPEKRPLLFLEVFARLHAADPLTHAVICGVGALEAACRERAAQLGIDGAVTFMGAVRNMAAMLDLAALLLHVSEFEGTPNILLEAQARGIPVICCRTGGSEDSLCSELRPYAYDSADLDAMVEGGLRLLADEAERRRLGEKARAYVLEHHSVPALVARTLEVADANFP